MAVKHFILAALCATTSLAFAGPMQTPAKDKNANAYDGAPTHRWHDGGEFTNGPRDTSQLGNGGITGGKSAPPPFTNIAPGNRPDAVTVPPVQVPEPATGALILAGLLGAGFVSRRRRK